LGQKSHLSGATKQYFSTSGASHILAVSGLHVGIIFMAISLLLRPLTPIRWTLKIQQLLVITLLWGYAFLCGLPPSIVRAVTMFSVGALGVIVHQQSQSLNNVCFTAFAMLLYNPNYLFDMGFQLSFSAVIGILLYVNSQKSNFASKREQRQVYLTMPSGSKIMSEANKVEGQKSELLHRLFTSVKEMCGVSIAAQLATLPLILYYFGSFPTYFLITNLTVVPLGTLLVYSCLILFMASPFAFARWMDYPIDFLGTSMQGITQAISHFPQSKISGISIEIPQVFLLYAVLFGLYYFYLQPSGRRLNILLGLVVVYLAFGLAALIKLASIG
jgi:competence protein ComEC